MIEPWTIAETSKKIIAFMHDRVKVAPYSELRAFMHEELTQLLAQASPTPAGSSDSDMYVGASSSQSRESGVEPRQGEGVSKRERDVAQIEHMEKLYRSWGAFEMAVQCQRSADYVASGGELGESICVWLDRGIDRTPYYHEQDHMVWVQMPNTMFFVMPKDVQLDLWIILTNTLGLTEDDLLDAAWAVHQRTLKELTGESL